MNVSQMPPQDHEAEEAILGAMILSDFARERAIEVGLTPAMFARPSHRVVFEAIERMQERGEIDELTLVRKLKAGGKLDAAGGQAAVLSLYERAPTVANARAYAVAVRDTAILRSLVSRGEQISALGYERPDEPVELVARAGQIIDEMTEGVSHHAEAGVTTAAAELMPFVEAMQERLDRGGQIAGIATGLTQLDQRIGGLQPGRLTIIAGRPGMGKSALSSGIAENVVFGSGGDAYIVNLEMREQEQAGRLLARAGAVDLHRATNGLPTEADVEGAANAAVSLYEAAHRLHLDQASDLTVSQIRQRARRLQRSLRREGRELSLIVVDYLQLITPPAGERNETAALTIISRGLKSMALELGVQVIALSQLNRSVEERQPPRPRLSDLRGSGSIEQDADQVIFLFRPEYYLKGDVPFELQGFAECIAAKNRGGTLGTDELRWQGERVRFTDWKGASAHRVPGVAA